MESEGTSRSVFHSLKEIGLFGLKNPKILDDFAQSHYEN
jgi:hypothetical protein